MYVQVSFGQQEELSVTRQHITFCFDNIRSYLMPHPGKKVALGGKEFSGQLKRKYSNSVGIHRFGGSLSFLCVRY